MTEPIGSPDSLKEAQLEEKNKRKGGNRRVRPANSKCTTGRLSTKLPKNSRKNAHILREGFVKNQKPRGHRHSKRLYCDFGSTEVGV